MAYSTHVPKAQLLLKIDAIFPDWECPKAEQNSKFYDRVSLFFTVREWQCWRGSVGRSLLSNFKGRVPKNTSEYLSMLILRGGGGWGSVSQHSYLQRLFFSMLQNYLFGSRKPQIFFFYYFVDNLDWASHLKFVKFGLFVFCFVLLKF